MSAYIRLRHGKETYLIPQLGGYVTKETLQSVVPNASGIKFMSDGSWACLECREGRFKIPADIHNDSHSDRFEFVAIAPETSSSLTQGQSNGDGTVGHQDNATRHSSILDTTRHALGSPSSLAASVSRLFGNATRTENTSSSGSSNATGSINSTNAASTSTSSNTVFNPRGVAPYSASHRRGLRHTARQQLSATKSARHQQPKPVKVAFLKNFDLPSPLLKENIIVNTVVDLAVNDEQVKILDRLLQIIQTVPGFAEISRSELQFLQCEKKQLSRPVVAVGYEWTGQRLKCLMGQGRLYVQVTRDEIFQASESMKDDANSDSDFELPSFIPRIPRSNSNNNNGVGSNGNISSSERCTGRHVVGSEVAGPSSRTENQDIGQNTSAVEFNFTEFMPMEFLDEASALQEALRRSVANESEDESECEANLCVEEIPKEEVEGLLQAHAEKLITGPERMIHVCRQNIWKTCLPFFLKPSFPRRFGLLKLIFSSDEEEEDGADLGGPRREFFRLLLKAICRESGTLAASPLGYLPRCSITGITKGTFRVIGLMLATMIIQGGEPPAIFSPCLVQYIINGNLNAVDAGVEDIPDKPTRSSLQSVESAENEDELVKALENCDWRFDIDGLPPIVNMDNKGSFVRQACLHHTVIVRKAAIDQLLSGLEYYQVLHLIRSKPALACLLEYNNTAITAHAVIALLKPCYSVAGSIRRTREEVVVTKFRALLSDIEEGDFLETLANEDLTPEEEKFIKGLSASHILAFTTGSGKVPAAGFDVKPKITFVHDETKSHPMAQTCTCSLILPVNCLTTGDSKIFERHMIGSLMNGYSFSTV